MAIPQQLIERLLRLTRQKKLVWVPVGASSLRAETGNTIIGLAFAGGVSSMTLFDADGNTIEQVADPGHGPLRELYEVARRITLEVDQKLAVLESDLRELEQK